MIKHELIKKGHLGHAIITNTRNPNIFMPAKVVIKDVKFDESNPQYLVKIIKFYDNTHHLRTNFMNMPFKQKFNDRSKNLKFPAEFYPNTPDELSKFLNDHDEKYYIVIDSINCFKYKGELEEMYNKLQDYMIEKSINDLRWRTTKKFYTGRYKITSQVEYFKRLKKMVVDLVAKTDAEWKKYVDKF